MPASKAQNQSNLRRWIPEPLGNTYGVKKSYKSLAIALLTCLQLPITTIAVAFLILLDGGRARPQ